MTKKISPTLFFIFLPTLILLIFVIYQYNTINHSQRVRIAIEGYDPRHLLAGHYINYRINWDKTDCTVFKNNTCPVEQFAKEGRFYIPQEKAKSLEQEINTPDSNAEIIFAYQELSTPIALELIINQKSYQSKSK